MNCPYSLLPTCHSLMINENSTAKVTKNRRYLPKWSIWLGLGIFTMMVILQARGYTNDLFHPLEQLVSQTENQYQKWGESQPLNHPWILIPFAVGGGLLASISPCILALLPVNLSYIGTLNLKSRREAFWNATGFVLGVVTVLSIFGLFSSVAGAIMVDWRGYINLAIGCLIILMGLSFGG
jgi:cytochrome c-type biogenesis protein